MIENVNKLYELETSLFKKEYLNNKEYLENIFHDSFMEYGKSGLIYRKQDTIESLYNMDDRDICVEDFTCEKIDNKTYIVHYISKNSLGECVYRTSIWVENGDFQLYFHQGTIKK